MEKYESEICQNLKKEIEQTDSIKKRKILVIKYLGERIKNIENIIAQDCIDDIDCTLMLECLWNDLILAKNTIKL